MFATAGLQATVSEAIESLKGWLFELLQLAALLAAFYLLVKFLMARRHRRLVMPDLSNGTGLAELDGRMAGLSELAREQLVTQLQRVATRVRLKSADAGLPGYSTTVDRASLPEPVADEQLSATIASLGDFLPQARPALAVLGTAGLQIRGHEIRGTVQRLGSDLNNRLGLTLRVNDLRAKEEPQQVTIWEGSRPVDQDHSDERKLSGSLDAPEDVSGRLVRLMEPAARWLALELARRELVVRHRTRFQVLKRRPYIRIESQQEQKHTRGLIANFFGTLFRGSGENFSSSADPFFSTALRLFESAEELDPSFYQAFENHADALTLWAELVEDPIRSEYLATSLPLFNRAIEMAAAIQDPGDSRVALRRIKVGKAIALLKSNDQLLQQASKSTIEHLESEAWQPAEELNARTLYNLACWYGAALERRVVTGKSPLSKARLYLAYSLARSNDFWQKSDVDPDCSPLLDGLRDLKGALLEEIEERGLNRHGTGQEFLNSLDGVLKRVGWG